MRQLVTPGHLDERSATSLVRLAVQLHDAAPEAAGLRVHGAVALVLTGRTSAATKLRLEAAIERVGAEVVRCRVTRDGLTPLPGHAGGTLDLRSPLACVVSGMRSSAIAAVPVQTGIPTFNAGIGAGDPWPLLAEEVAHELATARVAHGAVDGMAELRVEALVPTAAAIIATLSGAVPEPSADEPAHWFG